MKRLIGTLLLLSMLLSTMLTLASCDLVGQKVLYKLEFVVDGEVIATESVYSDGSVKLPETPIKAGYTFGGWYWDEGSWQKPLTTVSLTSVPLEKNMRVYAKWSCPHASTTPSTENLINPGCAGGSYDLVIRCNACNEEISRTKETLPAVSENHTPGDVVLENVVAAKCYLDGHYDEVIYCSACDAELSRVTKTIPMSTASHTDIFPKNGICDRCGKDLSTKTTADFVVPDGGYDGSAVTIRFYHTMGSSLRAVLDEAIGRFNLLYPNITIEHEQVGSYDDVRERIKHEITAGTQPSIAYCYPDHVALYNLAKATIKLDNLIASTITVTRADGTSETLGLTAEDIANFIPGYYAEGAQFDDEGTMYTMPLSKSTELLYYNKTFFEEHNLAVPTTWAEMEEVCRMIKQIDPTCIPLGYDSESNWFITMCEQYGSPYTSATGDHYVFDNDTNYAFVAMLRDWYQKGYVTTQELNGGKYSSNLFTATSDTKCYMSIGSSAGANHYRPYYVDFEVGCTIVPQVNPTNPKVISLGPSLCIFGKENAQEVIASWLFVKFLTTDVEFQSKFSKSSGYTPVINSVFLDPEYVSWLNSANGYTNLTALAVKQSLAQADAYFSPAAFNGSSTARDKVGILIQNCLYSAPASGESVDDMIKRLFKEAIDQCEYDHPSN